MHVARPPASQKKISNPFLGIALSVAFAEGEAIEGVKKGATDLALMPPFHVSDGDAYFVLPDDIGIEIVDIMRDGDIDLLHEAMRDGLFVFGSVERDHENDVVIAVKEWQAPEELLRKTSDYAATVHGSNVDEIVTTLNGLDHTQITVCSHLVDDNGLESMLGVEEFLGESWTSAQGKKSKDTGIDPTYAWSKRLPSGRVGIEFALFSEYEELVALLRPAVLEAAGG